MTTASGSNRCGLVLQHQNAGILLRAFQPRRWERPQAGKLGVRAVGTPVGRGRAKKPGFSRVGSERANRGKSRASWHAKARHLGPAARVVMTTASGSNRCGLVLQHQNAGIFLRAFQPRRWERPQAGKLGVRAVGTPAGRGRAKKPGFSRVGSERANRGKSRASWHAKARHLGPAARVVMTTASGSNRCGLVMQHQNAGILLRAFQPRRWERPQAGKLGVRAVGTPVGRGRAKKPGFSRVGSERANRGKSRASWHAKARHLGPAARVVMTTASGSNRCGLVLQHQNAGIFLRAFQPRRWERPQAGKLGVRAVGTPVGRGRAKKPGFSRVGSERANRGKSRASWHAKARHLGPAARVVMTTASGSNRCGLVLQHQNAGIFLRAFQPRRWERPQAGKLGVRAVGTPAGRGRAKKPGFSRVGSERANRGKSRALAGLGTHLELRF